MSIYSGFPTRKDETKYNQLLSKLILLLQQHLLQSIQGALTPKQTMAYTKVLSKMKEYEQHKYLPPKFSELLTPLSKLLGLPSKTDSLSDTHDHHQLQQATEKTKSFAYSTSKMRVKSKLAVQVENNQNQKHKHSLLQEELSHFQSQKSGIKKKLFQSTHQLKERVQYPNIQVGQKIEVGDTYEEEICKNNRLSGSHPLISNNKLKNNLRYRAFQALTDAQENLHKRSTPLRQQMRKKLKTTQSLREPHQ